MTVYLVGAGPGDPRLLTLAAAELLGRADVVIHDRLVDERTLALVRGGAEVIDVGKAPYGPGTSQAEINALLIARADVGLVVRLKGGDPYVFGRGGEEAAALGAAGIAYEVVPGVSSIAAVAAAAGMPLSVRGVTSTIVVVTGHDPEGTASAPVDWASLGGSGATLVLLMGVARRAEIAKHLIAAGRPPSTPVLVVERGTTPEQRSVRTTLEGLGTVEVENPATILVGELAAYELAGYEQRPLFAWRVLITRPVAEPAALEAALSAAGARPLRFPTIAIGPAQDGGVALRAAVARLHEFAWTVCTSANGVEALFAQLHDARDLAGVRLATVGPATAQAALRRGVQADLVAAPASAAGLLAAFPAPAFAGARVLLAQATRARPLLSDGLAALGYEVEVVEAYETVLHRPSAPELEAARRADAVVFTSSSTVTGFLEALPDGPIPPVVVTIGPATSATARAGGIAVDIEAATHTGDGIVEALAAFARAGAHTPYSRGREGRR